MIYGTVEDQLSMIGKIVDGVAPDGNCLFESVARLMDTPDMRDHRVLRALTVERGNRNPELYEDFLAGDRDQFKQQLLLLQKDGVWNIEIGDVAITMLRDALDIKIAVLQNYQKPQHFPADGRAIDRNTMVIVRDGTRKHYDSTKERGITRFYGVTSKTIDIKYIVSIHSLYIGNCESSKYKNPK